MSLPRFLVSQVPAAGKVSLEEAEAHHARNVLRLAVGDEIILFDGQGREGLAQITIIGKRAVEVELHSRTDTDRELPIDLHLAVALPKGDRQKHLVDGLVQLGVTALTPLVSQRSVAQPSGKSQQRLQRYIVEASKQCGRNRLMRVNQPLKLTDLVNNEQDGCRLFAHPYGENSASLLSLYQPPHNRFVVAIGPEGGFAEEEAELLAHNGWKQAILGKRLLRVEMAAIAVAASLANLAEQ